MKVRMSAEERAAALPGALALFACSLAASSLKYLSTGCGSLNASSPTHVGSA